MAVERPPIPAEATGANPAPITLPSQGELIGQSRRGPVTLEPSTSRLAKRSRVIDLWEAGAVIPGFRIRSRRSVVPQTPLTRSGLRRAEILTREIGHAYVVNKRVGDPAKEDFIDLMDEMGAVGTQSDPDYGNYNATVERQTKVDDDKTDKTEVYNSLTPERRQGVIVKEGFLTLTSGDEIVTPSGETILLEDLLVAAKSAALAMGASQEAVDSVTINTAYRILSAQRLKEYKAGGVPIRGLVLTNTVGVRFAAVDQDREMWIKRPRTISKRMMTPREKSKQRRFKQRAAESLESQTVASSML